MAQACVGFLFADETAYYGRIHRGVSVYETPVGGLTKAEAKAKLEPEIAAAMKKPLALSEAERSWSVSTGDFEAQADLDAAVETAFARGRAGSVWERLTERATLWFREERVAVSCVLHNAFLQSFVGRVAQQVDQPARDATLEVEGTRIELVKAKEGREVKKESLAELIRTHLADPTQRRFTVPTQIARVEVADKDALKARQEVTLMISSPITLKSDEETIELSRAKIGGLIGFKKLRRGRIRPILAHDKFERCFSSVKAEVETAPVDATFQAEAGVVTIIPSQPGYVIDWGGLYREVTTLTHRKAPRLGKFRVKAVQPVRTTERAQAMGIKERVSTWTEQFGYDENRSSNIGLLADTLDNRLVAPGEVFSINETTGKRTPAKGYKQAPVIMDGQLSLDYAGGVCNVSTCFFNSVFFGGYPAIERNPHGFYIEHYPPGRDASIDYASGMDFRWKNDTPYYVLVRTAHSGTSITVSLYSTSVGNEVSYRDTGLVNVVPFQTIYKDDPTIPTGYEKDAEFSFGVDGREITVWRTVKRNGQVVLEDKFFSHYDPKQRLLLKGTGAPLPPGAPPPPDCRPYAPPPAVPAPAP